MMIRLIPEQVSKFWDIIKYALEDFPPASIEVRDANWINNILISAMDGSIQVWASYDRLEEGINFKGIVITSIEVDKFVKQKNLLIYYVYMFNSMSVANWTEGLDVVRKYAKSRKCSRVLAYSNIPEIINISKKLGGDVSTTFIAFDLGGK